MLVEHVVKMSRHRQSRAVEIEYACHHAAIEEQREEFLELGLDLVGFQLCIVEDQEESGVFENANKGLLWIGALDNALYRGCQPLCRGGVIRIAHEHDLLVGIEHAVEFVARWVQLVKQQHFCTFCTNEKRAIEFVKPADVKALEKQGAMTRQAILDDLSKDVFSPGARKLYDEQLNKAMIGH